MSGVSTSSLKTTQAVSNLTVLCVDLDGTLCRTDTLIEAFVDLFRKQPLAALRVLLYLFSGKAAFKREVGRLSSLNVATLPYSAE
jgi:hypothetical protein